MQGNVEYRSRLAGEDMPRKSLAFNSRPGGQSDPVASPALGWFAGLVLTDCELLFSRTRKCSSRWRSHGRAVGGMASGQGVA